jgi:AraC-like DNA-binding protein
VDHPERLLFSFRLGCAVHVMPPGSSSLHAQWATTVAVGLEAPVEIAHDLGVTRGRVVIVPPGVRHITRCRGALVAVSLDADAHRAALLSLRSPGCSATSDEGVVRLAESLFDEASGERAVAMVGRLAPTGPASFGNVHIAAIMARVGEPFDERRLLGTLAREHGLSDSYLSALFHEVVGLPMRSWLVWKRTLTALRVMTTPTSLASAALVAGFSDQPHLTRVARRVLGHTPGSLRRALRSRFALLGRTWNASSPTRATSRRTRARTTNGPRLARSARRGRLRGPLCIGAPPA